MATLSEENYLKTIYHLGKGGSTLVSTNEIAGKIEAKPSSVTDMIKRLSEKAYVNYTKYQGVSLTLIGKKAAINVIRKHRLWEVFLVEKLGFAWDEVHDIAEQLEHIQSEELIDKLDAHLGHPTHDPHGDPIPDKEGNIKRSQKILLSQVNEEVNCKCIGVKDSSASFLKYLDNKHIALGTELKVLSKEAFDDSMTIKIKDELLAISKDVANNIFVKIN